MTKEEEYFVEIGSSIEDAEKSQMFGKPCFKIKGKAFICFFQNSMVFKLSGDVHTKALELAQSKLFDPSGKKRPMKEWVQVSYEDKDQWQAFAMEARQYVSKDD